jgi:energy-converting hydrogenase Eha subunit C
LLTIISASIPLAMIAASLQISHSAGSLAIGIISIGCILCLTYASIGLVSAITAIESMDISYTNDDTKTVNTVVLLLSVAAMPIMAVGGVYAYILPIDEKCHYNRDKCFSLNPEKIPTIGSS